MTLVVNNLGIARNDLPLLKGVNFMLPAGQSIRLQGHNGVGKTTLLKVLCGLRPADIGQVCWHDKPIQRSAMFRQDVRFVGHKLGIKAELTIEDNWRFASALLAVTPSETVYRQLAHEIGLSFQAQQADWSAGELSAGQQRRVALARLRLGAAKLWILDEPFVSLDAEGQAMLTTWIKQFLANGGSVLFTAHHKVDFPCDVVDLSQHAVTPDDILDWAG